MDKHLRGRASLRRPRQRQNFLTADAPHGTFQAMTQYLSSSDDLAALIPDGAQVAIAKPPLSPCALAGAMIRRGVKNLHLVTSPTQAYIADLLIGGGSVSLVETSGVSLGELGPAPRFTAAVKSGAIRIKDSTCPAVYAAIQAGEKGQPFAPLRGLIGSDVLASRPDYKVIDNPFEPGDDIVLLPAIRPEFALIHAAKADRFGNVWVGGRHELKSLSHAAKQSLITVEEIVEGDLRLDETTAPNLISGLYATAIAKAPHGAWPDAAPGYYGFDEDAVIRYGAEARSDKGFNAWLSDHILPSVAAE